MVFLGRILRWSVGPLPVISGVLTPKIYSGYKLSYPFIRPFTGAPHSTPFISIGPTSCSYLDISSVSLYHSHINPERSDVAPCHQSPRYLWRRWAQDRFENRHSLPNVNLKQNSIPWGSQVIQKIVTFYFKFLGSHELSHHLAVTWTSPKRATSRIARDFNLIPPQKRWGTLQEITYPTWGKGKSSSKCHFGRGYASSQEGTLTSWCGWPLHHYCSLHESSSYEHFRPTWKLVISSWRSAPAREKKKMSKPVDKGNLHFLVRCAFGTAKNLDKEIRKSWLSWR